MFLTYLSFSLTTTTTFLKHLFISPQNLQQNKLCTVYFHGYPMDFTSWMTVILGQGDWLLFFFFLLKKNHPALIISSLHFCTTLYKKHHTRGGHLSIHRKCVLPSTKSNVVIYLAEDICKFCTAIIF